MPKNKRPYPAAFRQQMVELVRAGRRPTELGREFDCSPQSISNWVTEAARPSKPAKPPKDGLSTAEREELMRLRKQVRQLQTERDILAKATAWFAVKGEKTFTPSSNS
jgi:transposase